MLRACLRALQFLLDQRVALLQAELEPSATPGRMRLGGHQTYHRLGQGEQPQAYVSDRYDKTKQPQATPTAVSAANAAITGKRRHRGRPCPRHLPTTSAGQHGRHWRIYWGYGSGVVATKVPDWGEFVLAELTQPFDQPDVSYFQPLMAATEQRLGFRPPYGAFDAAFDAFYIYEYFDQPSRRRCRTRLRRGPLLGTGRPKLRFDCRGRPLRGRTGHAPRVTPSEKTTLIQHQWNRYVCPLRFPETTAAACPVDHKQWAKDGCTATLPTSPGVRLRYQLDRDSDLPGSLQATHCHRTYQQPGPELGIERPRLRNGQAVAHLNTLIYVLINLRAPTDPPAQGQWRWRDDRRLITPD